VAQIQIYSKSWCPYCQMAKRLLRAKGQSWEEVDLEEAPSRRQEMVERSGGRTTVPQIWIGERHVGGFDELSALEAAGELDVHKDYASPLPRLVMMDFLGISPEELSGSFASMSRVNIVDCFGPRVTPELRAAANEAIQKSMDYVAKLYDLRRLEPRDDELRLTVARQHEHGQALEGHRLVAGQVGQVRADREEQGVHALAEWLGGG